MLKKIVHFSLAQKLDAAFMFGHMKHVFAWIDLSCIVFMIKWTNALMP